MKTANINELIPDANNLNKGSEYGKHLIDKSIEEFGLGRGIIVDKNNNIIGGNHITQAAIEKGLEKMVIVETTGDTLVVTKRMDIDKSTPEGLALATVMGLADNQTNKINYVFNADVSDAIISEAVCEEWGVLPAVDFSDKNKEIDIDELETDMVLKLKYNPDDYESVKNALNKIDGTPEQAIWKLLKL